MPQGGIYLVIRLEFCRLLDNFGGIRKMVMMEKVDSCLFNLSQGDYLD